MKKIVIWTLILALLLTGCAPAEPARAQSEWVPERTMDLQYATQFQVDYYSGGYKLISLADGSKFLVVPEGCDVPENALKLYFFITLYVLLFIVSVFAFRWIYVAKLRKINVFRKFEKEN